MPRCVLVRRTSVQLSPPPVTPVTLVVPETHPPDTNASSSSLLDEVENALVTTVVAAVAVSPNAIASCAIPPPAGLDTVVARLAEVVVLPAASRATALSACAPLATPMVFHVMLYGAAVSSAPI